MLGIHYHWHCEVPISRKAYYKLVILKLVTRKSRFIVSIEPYLGNEEKLIKGIIKAVLTIKDILIIEDILTIEDIVTIEDILTID